MTVSYDGTCYAGWQIQPRHTTVQQKLQEAIQQTLREASIVHGSGRTDRGVHARRQVAHFDLSEPREPRRIFRSLNAVLPSDIRVMSVRKTGSDFHARRHAREKEYRYFIWNDATVPPFLRLYRTHVREPLDVDAMRKAARLLKGRHDFAAFTANAKNEVESTVRSLRELAVRQRGAEIVIVARSEGFLYKMVRSLAGFLIRVGSGEAPSDQAETILKSRQRTARVPTAPPEGLFLWQVTY
jgi:tRNA pseudouridine38-40 synthase